MSVFLSLLLTLRSGARSRAALQLEVLALRHQLQVLSRSRRPQHLRLGQVDRWLWVLLSQVWNEWRANLVIVKPETVIAWHRRGFRACWAWRSRRRLGRPVVPREIRALIRDMSDANPRWGAPRIHGELLKLGIEVCQATVAKYMVRRRHHRHGARSWRIISDRSWRPTSSWCLLRLGDSCLSWSCWPMSAVALCTWRSRTIRQRRGPVNSYAKRSRGTRRRDMLSGIAITRSTDGRTRRRHWGLRTS